MKQFFLELGEIKQMENESIELYYDQLNELIFKCSQYGVTRSSLEFNLTFLMELRKEWRNISQMTKTQEIFDAYPLANLYNVLKAHESEINDIDEKSKLSLGGPLALMSKVVAKDSEVGSVE